MNRLTTFIQKASWDQLDPTTRQSLREALADILACTLAGSQTEVVGIVKDFAQRQWGCGSSSVFLSPYKLTSVGASFINATMANALDIDDGHRLTKGHPGAVIFPAVLAAAEELRSSGREFLDALLVAYEIGIRAGILAHRLRPEYHCTGSWGALGAAAGVARILRLSANGIEQALGIAEYHATYSPMMRCIDVPSMLKDGISWGCMTGISSAYLAQGGFTAIPSLFAMPEAAPLMEELGRDYRLNQLYFKPHACCRWAQPAIEAMKWLEQKHQIAYPDIKQITIRTFTESARLSSRVPSNTEEAQYNLSFPLAAHLIHGEVGPRQVLEELHSREIHDLMGRITIQTDPELDAHFPQKALSRLAVLTTDGLELISPIMQARGDFDFPLSSEEKQRKFFWLTAPLLGETKSTELFEILSRVDQLANIRELTVLLRRNEDEETPCLHHAS